MNGVDIVQVAERLGVALKPSGDEYKGLCPLHTEDTPSFYVNPDKGTWYCFGCGQGGNAVSLVAKALGVDTKQAKRVIAGWFGIPLGKENEAEELGALGRLEALASDFHKHVDKAVDYLKRRGITNPSLIETFLIGFAPPGYSEGLDRDFALEHRLISEGGFETFANRVILPIHTVSGVIVGLSGRAVSDRVRPKYMTTSGFKKAEILYGMHAARDSIRRSGEAYIVEGQFDVLALHQDGITNAVAALGSSLQLENLIMLKRAGVERIVYLADGDQAGFKAMLHAFVLARSIGLSTAGFVFPKGKDAADFVGHLSKVRERALSEGELLYRIACKQSRCEPGRFVVEASKIVRPTSRLDPMFLTFAQLASQRFGFRERELYSAIVGRGRKVDELVKRVRRRIERKGEECPKARVSSSEAVQYAEELGVPFERVGVDEGPMTRQEEMEVDLAYLCILRRKLEEAIRAKQWQNAWELRTILDVYASKWKETI